MQTTDVLPMWSRNHVQRRIERGGTMRSILWVYVAARKKRERSMMPAPFTEMSQAGANVVPFRQPATA